MHSTDKPAPINANDPALRQNVELKARIPSLSEARVVAARLATEELGVMQQVDTYFACTRGRLKLREIDDAVTQLIWYERADRAEPRSSHYYLLDVSDRRQTKELLTAALGIHNTVVKRREVFLVDNVRIHLDDVDGLGSFLEFEAVMGPGDDPSRGHQQLARLLREFSIRPDQILSSSYGDMKR